MSRETRAMQDDDIANPGMLAVLEGGALWARKTGAAGRACADCHGAARAGMKGVAARSPAYAAARLRAPRAPGADGVRGAPVARPADRHHRRRPDATIPRQRPGRVLPAS